MSTQTIATLVYAATPPSLNRIGTRGSRWAVHSAKKRWQHILEGLLLEQNIPALQTVEASAVLRFPTRRRRDAGNFSWMLEKALGDALQPRWLSDDTADRFRFFGVEFDAEPGPAQTTVTVIGRVA